MITTAHQCMYDLRTPSSDGGEPQLAKKPTRFMTNSAHMSRHLQRTCDGLHSHQHLVGGRCKEAAYYPLPLVKAILMGIKDTADALAARKSELEQRMERLLAISDSAGNIPVDVDAPSSQIVDQESWRRFTSSNLRAGAV